MRHKFPKRVKDANYKQIIKLAVVGIALVFIAVTFLPRFQASLQTTNTLNVPAGSNEQRFSIKGSIFIGATENEQQILVNLPGIEVFLLNTANGVEIGRTTTDFDGRFHILDQIQNGQFKVCWQGNGWQDGCGTEIITNNAPVQFINPLEASPVSGRTIIGRVTMKDGIPCTQLNEALGISQESFIQIIDRSGGTRPQPIKTNNDGFFALTRVTGNVSLRANCGSSTGTTSLQTNELRPTRERIPIQIKIDNTNPTVLSVVAYNGNDGIRFANQGQLIRIQARARDDEDDNLRHDFIISQNAGSLGIVTNDSVEWQLPDGPGNFTVYAVVSDNRGGVTFKTLSIIVNSNFSPLFSGKVVDEDNRPINEANVTINDEPVQTDRNGGFMINVSAGERYVMNVTKPGYVPINRIFDAQNNGSTWEMARAFSTTVDPTREIIVAQPSRKSRDRSRDIAGSTIRIPANVLINTRTRQPAQSPLQLNIATLDIGGGEMPGNNAALNRRRRETSLISFGAVFVEIRDATGDAYNLVSGTPASLTLPVEPRMLPTAPRTIQTWSFNPVSGIWNAMGTAQLSENVWQMPLTTISTVNADLDFNTPACVQINLDPNLVLKGAKARFSGANTSNLAQIFDVPLNDPITTIHHLIPNVLLTVEVIDTNNIVIPNIEVKLLPSGPVLSSPFIFNSGTPNSLPQTPVYPYSACNQKINLKLLIPDPPNLQFLTRKGIGNAVTSLAYINVIDPLPGNRRTLGNWWLQNGFDQNGAAPGEVSSAYFNDNDLHFGREMHCLKTGLDVACYVSNYFDANAAQAALNNPLNKTNAGATVAMEYKAIDGQSASNRIVKFFAYLGGVASSPLLLSPDLDLNGPKGMPQLCIQCHGGNYSLSNPTQVDLRSSFREFDLNTFLYPNTNPRIAQESKFKTLNNIVKDSAPSPAIQDLITNWYPGSSPTQINTYVPPDWSSNPSLYLNVVATSCRTCHIAQPDNSSSGGTSGIDFTKFDVAGTSDFKGKVFPSSFCGPSKYMPHAKVTYENFWFSTNPARPQLLSQTLFGTPCMP